MARPLCYVLQTGMIPSDTLEGDGPFEPVYLPPLRLSPAPGRALLYLPQRPLLRHRQRGLCPPAPRQPEALQIPGDDKGMVTARNQFLSRDYYAPLRDALCALALEHTGEQVSVLDSGCGRATTPRASTPPSPGRAGRWPWRASTCPNPRCGWRPSACPRGNLPWPRPTACRWRMEV